MVSPDDSDSRLEIEHALRSRPEGGTTGIGQERRRELHNEPCAVLVDRVEKSRGEKKFSSSLGSRCNRPGLVFRADPGAKPEEDIRYR